MLAVVLVLAVASDARPYTGTREDAALAEPAVPPSATPPPVIAPSPDASPATTVPRNTPSASVRRSHGEVRPYWFADAAVVLATLVPATVLRRAIEPRQALEPLPDEPDVGRFDRLALDRFSPRAARASDALLAITLAAVPTVTLVHGRWAADRATTRRGRAFARSWLGVALVEVEAVSLSLLVTSALKHAVARPRPFTSLTADEVAPGDREALDELMASPDRHRSFPSGHSSTAFATMTALATSLTIEHPRTRRSRAVVAVVWAAGMTTAATVATLRVVAGRHYPSDVAAGSALGFGIGAAVPLMHACWLRGGYGRRSCAAR